jgi:hypothetical protein
MTDNTTMTRRNASASTWGLRAAASCGVLYPVLLIVGDDVIGQGDRVATDDGTPAEVAAAVAEHASASYFYGSALGTMSTLCLFVFAAFVAHRIRLTRGPESLWPALALGAGAMATTLLIVSAVPSLVLVERAGAGADPELLMALLDFGLPFMLSMLPMALLLAAVASEASHGQVVGRGVAWVGGVLAVAMLIGFVLMVGGVDLGFLPLPLSWLWFIAAGISAVRRVPAAVAEPTPAGP